MNKIIFSLIMIFIASMAIQPALAVLTEPNIFRYSELLINNEYNDTNIPVIDVNVIGFVCSSANCETVSHSLDLSNGNVIADIANPPILNSGGSDQVNVIYPTTRQSTYGYGIYFYKDGFIPYEGNVTLQGTYTANTITNYLTKKELCIAPIENLTVLNDAQANVPLIINVDASLDATTHAAIEAAGPLDYVPSIIADQYAVETTIVMTVYNSSDDVVYTDTMVELIPYSGSANVEFTWTPTIDGTYKVVATSTATDDKCLSSDTQTAQKDNLYVYPAAPRDECYTILNGLSATGNPHHELGEEITISYNKISNYANDEVMGTPAYELTPLETRMTYTIKNDAGATVYSLNPLIAANPTNDTSTYNFAWTPTTQGNYTISISGVAENALCVGKTNPVSTTETIDAVVLDTLPPQILSLEPSSDMHVNTFNLEATTDETATCKYDVSDVSYDTMANTFATTDATTHTQSLTLVDGTYSYYVRCMDVYGNKNQQSNSTSFEVDTKPHIVIHVDNVSVDQTEVFTLTATLENNGYSQADGNLTITIPDRLNLTNGNLIEVIAIPNGINSTYTWDIDAVWWGDYIIDIVVDYNGLQETAEVYVQSKPIPIYEYRIATPDNVVIGDTVQVAVGIYNRGVVDGTDVPVSITTNGNLEINGSTSKIIPVVGANTTTQDATWVEFYVKGVTAGTGTIDITVDGKTQQKTIVVKDTHLYIDLSVTAIGPFNMSLGRAFLVSAVIYNTGNSTYNWVQTTMDLDTGLLTTSTNPVNTDHIDPTVNGNPPVKIEWIVNSTNSGAKQINFSVVSLDPEQSQYNASDSIMVNILDMAEPVQPYLDITLDGPTTFIEYGTTFDITADIKNIGTDSSINTNAIISGIDGLTIITANPVTLGNIAIDETKSASWTINATQTGIYDAKITASEIQHMFFNTTTFEIRHNHDVRLSGTIPTSATTGTVVNLAAALQNLGLNDEQNVNVTFYVDGTAVETKTYDINMSDNIAVSFLWTAVVGTHNIVLSAELGGDEDTLNNNVTGTIIVSDPAPTPPPGGGGGGSSTTYVAPPQENETNETIVIEEKQLEFSNLNIPTYVAIGEPIVISGCLENAENLTADNKVQLYIDGELVVEQELDNSKCFTLMYSGTLDVGNHEITVKISGTDIVKTATITVYADIKITSINTEELIVTGRNSTINTTILVGAPGDVEVVLFVNGDFYTVFFIISKNFTN